MSSGVEVVGEVAAGLVMLAGGATIATVKTADQMRKKVEDMAEQKGAEIRRIMDRESLLKEKVVIEQYYMEFIADIEELLDTARTVGMQDQYVEMLGNLHGQAKETVLGLRSVDKPDIGQYYNMLNKLLETRKSIEVSVTEYSDHRRREFFDRISMLEKVFSSMKIEDRKNGVIYITPQQKKKNELNKEFKQLINKIRDILIIEQKRSRIFPVSEKNICTLKRLFDGIDTIVNEFKSPEISNGELEKGIEFLQERLKEYSFLMEILNQEEAEFMAYYEDYHKIMEELGQEYYLPIEFSDMGEMKENLEVAREKLKVAEQKAKLFKMLGKEAYICYAYDEELRALGYEVMSDTDRIKEIKKELGMHVSNGFEIPAYNAPDNKSALQIYDIDENCELQVIVHPDGSTTMATFMKGNDADHTIASQKKYCRKSKVLARRLRENWFIISDLQETESPSKVKHSSIGIRQDIGIRTNERTEVRNERTMSR